MSLDWICYMGLVAAFVSVLGGIGAKDHEAQTRRLLLAVWFLILGLFGIVIGMLEAIA